jgi:hypothetical protein
VTPERAAAVVLRWVRWYTRNLPASVADRRLEEVEADLHDHIQHERANGASDAQIVVEILSRLTRGLLADASWRRDQLRRLTHPEGNMGVRKLLSRPVARISIGVAALLAFPAIATPAGAADWSFGDFVLAGSLLALVGVTIELAVRSAGSLVGAAAIATLGIAAGFAGDADDAPGLTLIGVLLVASAGLLVVRLRRHAR